MQFQKNRILELDALRGIAALAVFLYHSSILYKDSIYFSIFRFGLTGVDLFFIISGFVIFSSIKQKTRIQFVTSRFIRLFPTYWIAVTCTFTLIIIKYYDKGILHLTPINQYLANLTMVQEFFNIENLDGPYWTLYIELFFYLLVFVFIRNEKLLFLTISIIILATVFSRLELLALPMPFSYLSTTPISAHASLFLIGMLFYKFREHKNRVYLITIIIGFITQGIIYFKHYNWIKNTDISFEEHIIILIILFIVFILFTYNRLSFLKQNKLIFLGEISYALYLIHQYLTTEILEYYLVQKLHLKLGIVIFAIALPIVIILSILITKQTEKISSFLKKIVTF
jgi:peptidoglycan/LPS O-acetylase OafA/YrhL